MLSIGVVTAIPTPYRDAFWNCVAAKPGTKLHVYYCANITADRPWTPSWDMRYESEVLPGYNVLAAFPSKGFSYWNPQIKAKLRAGNHDALVIGGYNYPTMLAAIHFARRHGIPYFLMSESHLNEPRSAWRHALKRPLVRWVVGGAAGCFPTGTWARDYLMHYGAKSDELWFLPNVPDVESLDRQAQELAPRRDQLRARWGLGDGPVVLYLGRLVEFKRVDLLIEAFASPHVPRSARLVIVGDGMERPALEALTKRLGVDHRVVFKGFVDPAEVPLWYAMADLFVLPSIGETWSVAIIEALASGLPVVTTDSVGAAVDAITDPLVGTVIRSGDARALAAAITERLADPAGRTLVRERWAQVREQFQFDASARRFVDAIRSVVHRAKTANRG